MYERFVQLLEEFEMSAYAVSKATGVTQSTLSAWKHGGKLRSGTLKIIADFFGVSAEWLRGDVDERTKIRAVEAQELINEDEELTDFLELLVKRPECRMLFSLSKNATKEDVEFVVKMLEELRNRSNDE